MNNLKVTTKYPHQTASPQQAPEYVKEFARNMEKQFLEHMIEKMDKSGGKDSTSKSYYKSLLRSERADLMTKVRNGIGIQEMIVNDYMKKFRPRPINTYQNQQRGGANE